MIWFRMFRFLAIYTRSYKGQAFRPRKNWVNFFGQVGLLAAPFTLGPVEHVGFQVVMALMDF